MPDEPAHPIRFGGATPGQPAAPAPSTFKVTINFPAGWSEPVELLTATGRVAYAGAPTPWVVDLPSGLYGVYLAGTWQTTGLSEPAFTVTGERDVHL